MKIKKITQVFERANIMMNYMIMQWILFLNMKNY